MTAGAGRSSIGVRVRPNADNFIRDLKAQLLTRKMTYWVDVRAKMTKATADVKAWETAAQKNPISIVVGARTAQATKDLTEWRDKQRRIMTRIPVGLDLTTANREIATWRATHGRDLNVRVDANTDRVDDKLKGLFLPSGKFHEIRVDADTTKAEAKVEKVRAKAKDPVKTELEMNVAAAEHKVLAFRIREKAQKLGVTMDVDADTKKAKLQLRLLEAQAKLHDIEVGVRVKRNAFQGFQQGLKDIEKAAGKLTFLRSLDLGPFTLGKPTGLVGTLTTITALAGAIPGAVTASAALADALERMAGAAAIVPGALASVAASIATFKVATGGVGETIKAMFDLWTEGATAQASTARRAIQAQDQYRNALVDEKNAQRDLSTARQAALENLRNLNNELRGSVLNEAQAILDAQKARDRYVQDQQKGFATETDRMQGLLDIAKADQNVIDVRERNVQLQQKVNKANQQGIEGSDQVTSALEQQTRATQQAAEAMQAMASTQATGAMGKFNDLLAQLSPNAQQFVRSLMGLHPEMLGFRNDLQDIMFQGLGPAFANMFHNLLPVIGPQMREIARGLNQNILQVFKTLQTPDGKSILERIFGGTATAQKALSGLIDPLVRGFGTLMAAGSEHLPQLVELFTRLADRFAAFIEEADKSGALDKFMDRGLDSLSKMIDLGVNLIKIVGDLGRAFGGDLIGSLERLSAKWHTFLASDEGQQKIKDFIAEAKEIWDKWHPVLDKLPELLKAVGDAAHSVLDAFLPVLNTIATVLDHMPGAVQGFVTAWLGARVVVGALTPFAALVTGLVKGTGAIVANLNKIPGVNLPGGKKGVPGAAAEPGAAAAAGGAGPLGWIAAALALGSSIPTDPGSFADTLKHSLAPWTRPDSTGFLKNIADSLGFNFDSGGFTNWAQGQGVPAVLHGKEYVQPADTVSYYGVQAMQAIHEKRIPREAIRSYQGGGLVWDATSGKWVPEPPSGPTPTNAMAPNPYGGPGAVATIANGAASLAAHGANAAATAIQQASGPQGGGQQMVINPFGQPAPAPGPIGPGTPATPPPGGASGPSMNLFGFNIPLGGNNTPGGWGPGGPPVGLGGIGPDGKAFDIRNFGIGPGPAGSGPNDWMSFLGNWGGSLLGNLATTFIGGLSGALGFGDITQNSYVRAALGLGQHFLGAGNNADAALQAPGAGQTNADVAGLLNQYGGMPLNPDYPGVPNGIIQLPPGTGPGPTGPIPYNTKDPRLTTLSYLVGLAGQFGLRAGSGPSDQAVADALGIPTHFRDKGWHPQNRALDIGNTDELPQMVSAAQWWISDPTRVANTKELILSTPGWDPMNNIKDGKFIRDYGGGVYDPGTLADHTDHIHLALGDIPSTMLMTGAMPGAGVDTGGYGPLAQAGFGVAGPTPSLDMTVPDFTDTTSTPPTPPSWLQRTPGGFGAAPLTTPPGGWTGPSPRSWFATKNPSGARRPANIMGLKYPPGMDPNNPLLQMMLPQNKGKMDKAAVQRLAKVLYAKAGMPPGEWASFNRLVEKESSWDPTAKNPSSTAFGLAQFLDTTAAAYGIPYGTTNPVTQLLAMFQYLRDRYHGSPSEALRFHNANNWYDQGGWVPPGQTHIFNGTGKPELMVPWDQLASFQSGGYNFPQGIIPPKPPPPPAPPVSQPAPPQFPRGPEAQKIIPPPLPTTSQPSPPPITPTAPPMGTPPAAGPGYSPIGAGLGQRDSRQASYGDLYNRPGPGPGAESMDHVHPALKKGIASTASVLGNIAATAIAVGSMGLGGGLGGGGGAGGGGLGGGLGGFVSGLFQQGGKIAENIANVGSSFLVGNITGGTTANAYGVTQRGPNSPGRPTVIDASSTHNGDFYTQDLDGYFRAEKLREAQRAQANLGQWAR